MQLLNFWSPRGAFIFFALLEKYLRVIQRLNGTTQRADKHGGAWRSPCLLVGKTVWDAIQDFSEKGLVFLLRCCWE